MVLILIIIMLIILRMYLLTNFIIMPMIPTYQAVSVNSLSHEDEMRKRN